jgi:hypothetical protein
MAWTNQSTSNHGGIGPGRSAAGIKFVRVKVVSSATHLHTDRLEPAPSSVNVMSPADVFMRHWRWDTTPAEPSSSDVISPADAVRRYWRWDTMPETMRRLA